MAKKIKAQSTLRPEQEKLYQQLQNAGLNPGAGGAFGTSADYYRNLLSDDSEDFNAFAAPQLRQYYEDIVPNISEQFAGMGSGGLSSSGFQNAQVQGATDLSERLGALRASLRQSGAQGLQNIGQLGLNPYSENVRNTPQAGFKENLAEGIGNVLPSVANSWLSNNNSAAGNKPTTNTGPYRSGGNKVGMNTSPYGSGPQASPTVQPRTPLPNFLQR